MVLDVVDDGRGFDPADVLARPREGHFGVRVLADVASAAGADLSRLHGAGRRLPLAAPGAAPVIGVLLVDDHPLVRAGLAGLIGSTTDDISVLGEAGGGEEAVRARR